MFIILLFLPLFSCEWVEVSLNHYSKEPSRKVVHNENIPSRIYTNHTLPEHRWNKGTISRVNNIGNVKRVHHGINRAPSITYHENSFEDSAPVISSSNKNYGHSEQTKIVPNGRLQSDSSMLTAIKDQEYSNRFQTSVKSNKAPIGDSETYNKINAEGSEQSNYSFKSPQRINEDNIVNNSIKITRPAIFQHEINAGFVTQGDDNTYRMETETNSSNIRSANIFNYQYGKQEENISKNKEHTYFMNSSIKSNPLEPTLEENYSTDEIAQKTEKIIKTDTSDHSFILKNNEEDPNKGLIIRKTHENTEQHLPTMNDDDTKVITEETKLHNVISPMSAKKTEKTSFNDVHNENDKKESEIRDQDDVQATSGKVTNSNEDLSSSTNANSMNNIVKFIKLVADTISKNTRKSFKSKVRYLEDLKNTLLETIEGHIEHTWPDEEANGRSARAAPSEHAQARGHVEFPSSEGALMTISFLTFAVFLIKLVLQVIHTYKNKTMMVTPAVVAAVGRVAPTFKRKPTSAP